MTAPVKALTQRLLPQHFSEFTFKVIPKDKEHDVFEISSAGKKVLIAGSSPVAMASGLNWYLKHIVNCHVSWCGDQLNLPSPLPRLSDKIRKRTPYTKNFYFNYCTFSYSMPWWNWKRWEREIDYMALCGINMPLAVIGSEAIWVNFLKRFGYSNSEAKQFISGPGYFAWNLMGNLEGRGGPLTDEWIAMRIQLQKKILTRMREFGMRPVLPGFVGLVPSSLQKKFPDAKLIPQGKWGGPNTRPFVLKPDDPLFSKMAKAWYEETDKLFGKVDAFAGDLFHEGGRTGGINVPEMGAAVQKYMLEYNPDAVWFLQAWGSNPRKDLLSILNKEHAVVIDLCCEFWKRWQSRHGYENTPWIFSTIIMYGGNTAMHGRIDSIAKNLHEALKFGNNKPVGLGATWESIEINPVVMDFLWDMCWREKIPDITKWIERYSIRRYGMDSPDLKKVWKLLLQTVYKGHPGLRRPQETVLCAKPSLDVKKASPFAATVKIHYDPVLLKDAVGLLLKHSSECGDKPTYRYDAVDMTRQFISNTAQLVYRDMMDAYMKKEKKRFESDAAVFLQIFDDQDRLLGTEPHFLLGRWLHNAIEIAPTPKQARENEHNARLLITVWNRENSMLRDYAWKEWNGMMKSYYKPRWKMFIENLKADFEGKQLRHIDTYPFESSWAAKNWSEDPYPVEPQGNPVETAKTMYAKYCKIFDKFYKKNDAAIKLHKKDFTGSWEYYYQGMHWRRELLPDGTLKLFQNGRQWTRWKNFTWELKNGKALLKRADGSIFGRMELRNSNTAVFHGESIPHGKRVEAEDNSEAKAIAE